MTLSLRLLAVLLTILLGSAIGAVRINDALLGPTHPGSDAPALADGAVEWLWSGGISTDHAEVRARVVDGAKTRLAVSETADLNDPDARPAVALSTTSPSASQAASSVPTAWAGNFESATSAVPPTT